MSITLKLAAVLIMGSSLSLFGGTKLSKAAMSEDVRRVMDCLRAGEKVNELDKWGWTPLMWSIFYRQETVTEFLLANGADPNVATEKVFRTFPKGTTALMIAVFCGREKEAFALIAKGAKVDLVDANNKTALDYAVNPNFKALLEGQK